jgi:ProP effector
MPNKGATLKTDTRQDEALLWLQTQFPAAFSHNPTPLKIGIHQDIFALSRADAPEQIWIKRALRYYVNSPRYLRQLLIGRPRIDLNGDVAGEVTEQEEQHAKEIISAYITKSKLKKERKKVAESQPVGEKKEEELPQKEAEAPLFGKKLSLKKKLSSCPS